MKYAKIINYTGSNKFVLSIQDKIKNEVWIKNSDLCKAGYLIPPIVLDSKEVLERNRLRRRIYKLKSQPKSSNLIILRKQVRDLINCDHSDNEIDTVLDLPWKNTV